MKNILYRFGAIVLLFTTVLACTIEEEPLFIGDDVLFDNEVNAKTVLDGVYAGLAGYDYYSANYFALLNYGSGMVASQWGNIQFTLGPLTPGPATLQIDKAWSAIYSTIGRANLFIDNIQEVDFDDEEAQNIQHGQALMIRSLCYFNLVRVWGSVPLRTTTVDASTTHLEKSPVEDVYEQIIADAKLARELMKNTESDSYLSSRPTKYTASTLLADVYMHMAGNLRANETTHWDSAYVYAKDVYDNANYSLVSNFKSLWQPTTSLGGATSNFTSESIWEIEGSSTETQPLQHMKWSSGSKSYGGTGWSRYKANLEVYDRHFDTYGADDPRFDLTYITQFTKTDGKSTITYPSANGIKKRWSNAITYPYIYKYFAKDLNISIDQTDQSYVIYRYAYVLLMLAEIENELRGPADAYSYVNEVLLRARNSGDVPSTVPADWAGMDQSTFRDNIMKEYHFELYGEGHDYHIVRRRGFDYYQNFVLKAHNDHQYNGSQVYKYAQKFDHEYPTEGIDAERLMLMPIPSTEIIGNINFGEQNPGY